MTGELPEDYGTPEYEARWMRVKLRLPPDATTADVQGQMHVWDSRQHGYMAYIETHKCEDKQGEIARQRSEIHSAHHVLDILGIPRATPDSDGSGESNLTLLGRLRLVQERMEVAAP